MAIPWTDYAILQASAGGKQWKVQINGDGQFRCSCPSFIFCKGTKTCKHTRRCEDQQLKEAAGLAAAATSLVAASAVPVTAVPVPHLAEAEAIFEAMCSAGTARVRHNVKTQIGAQASAAMVEALRAKLAAWVPPAKKMATAAAAVVGIRHITLED